jgi:hypothetical protein
MEFIAEELLLGNLTLILTLILGKKSSDYVILHYTEIYRNETTT